MTVALAGSSAVVEPTIENYRVTEKKGELILILALGNDDVQPAC